MITPTPGRVVWFTPSIDPTFRPAGFEFHDIKQPCAATVAYVWGDRMVNLSVVDQAGKTFRHNSVALLQDDDRKPEEGRFCSWMPYQVGQAKKHEADDAAKVADKPAPRRADVSSDAGTPTDRGWRMAEQYFRNDDVELATKPWNDGYVMVVKIAGELRRVFFDPAGRITHTLPGR